MNLADPELELVDPTPNVHMLFIHFDKTFFWTKLSSRAVVRWSKRMYSCAGTCSYDRGGLCDIALSEPLLKLRPRKDLVETLLHEMIHAFLFVTNRDQDRDGHGPNFKQHMYRINKSAGLNISIYHDFHDEVELYQTHWWRCNGPCQTRKPHFGIVRRSANKAPGPSDFWFKDHKRKCGGTFIKFKEPEKGAKKSAKQKPKPNSDITKYITNNIKTINNNTQNDSNNPKKAVLKDTSNVSIQNNVKTKSNSSSTVVVTKKGVVYSPSVPKVTPTPVFTGNGQTIGKIIRSNTIDVAETVRNVWANKQLVPNVNKNNIASNNRDETPSDNKFRAPVKIKSSPVRINSPPAKIKKINDYFKTAATSVLKELYGENFKLTQPNDNSKLIAVTVKLELVDCPICSAKVNNEEINRHVDECLNKDVIEKLSKSCDNDGFIDIIPENNIDNKQLIDMPLVPAIKNEKNYVVNIKSNLNTTIDLTRLKTEISQSDKEKLKQINFEKKALVKFNSLDDNPQILNRNRTNTEATRKSESFVTKQRGDELKIKTEAGTSISDDFEHVCPCCGKKFDKPIREHLDECLIFFDNNTTVPEEAASTSFADNTIVIDDEEDMFDESIVLNATGTKTPCPCCMNMVEQTDMNDHLDVCLQS